MSNVRQIAFDSIERLNKLATTDAILGEMQRSCMSFGVENFCISGLPLPYEKLHPYILLSGWPEQWLTRYADNGYVHTDPVIKFLRRADMPFAWSEAPYNRSDKGEARVMNEATEFGLVEGLAIPIYAVNGFQAVVTFGARRLDLDKQRRAALHLIAIYAHGRIREILRKTNGEKESYRARLSPRQLECLRWASAGKTSWEISLILGISEKTVVQYFHEAAHKLQSVNRIQAVAEALRQNFIT